MVTVILNRHLTTSISFHDILHGFRTGCVIGTTYFEAKMIQKLTAMMEEFLYASFLDFHKSYDALDRDRCLGVMEWYRVGMWYSHILCAY